ncbi:phage/plasmid primase, P4 family [Methylobacterium sp. E-025]|uniref:phage/plasmid primase, P4 family n=1 Tax=Methylobacterium sp. E-025 TaxID=2836561 RepID=UPI001FBB0743|nr:phage/plasmid primase, P4 family [Methylobacterium sp. E-025]MCJ2110212.1 phage/plasmid primase, P4 family [Methylobacterium sp. E-025]
MNTYTPETYLNEGYDVTPLHPRTKKPKLPQWTSITLDINDFQPHGEFPNDFNLGVKLGTSSNGIVDVDLDCDAAVFLGQSILDNDTRVFGRESNPRSHYLYRVDDPQPTKKFRHPQTGKTLIELRGNGAQTVLPGSIYESGEQIRFEDDSLPLPSETDWRTLQDQCGAIAAGCVLSEFWVEGTRHQLAVALGGWAAHRGVEQRKMIVVITAVAQYRQDDDVRDRVSCVVDSYRKHNSSERVAWKADLSSFIPDERIMKRIGEWMNATNVPLTDVGLSNDRCAFDPQSDMSTGEAFCNFMDGALVYCDDQSTFYHRTGNVFDPVPVAAAKKLAIDWIKSSQDDMIMKGEVGKLKTAQSIARINAILEIAKAHTNKASREFDTDPFIVGCGNGVLDLRIGDIIDPTIIVTKRLGTNFNKNAECPLFMNFLGQVFNGDKAKISFVQRSVGYTLTGKTTGQCMFVAIGTGANGKSTFLKVIQSLLGDYAGTVPSHSLMQSKFGNDKSDDLASLVGKRLVCASEGESGQRLAVAKIKLMTGGDTIACRPLYQNYFYMQPEFKVWFATNDLPVIMGGDDAIWRRLHVIDFPVSFSEEQRDGNLFDKLRLELPGILNWALQGLQELGTMQGNFLRPPVSVQQKTGEYRSNSDTVGAFLEAACERKEGAVTMMNRLHERYTSWCDNSSIEPVPMVTFGRELTRLGLPVKKQSFGNGRLGVSLNEFGRT